MSLLPSLRFCNLDGRKLVSCAARFPRAFQSGDRSHSLKLSLTHHDTPSARDVSHFWPSINNEGHRRMLPTVVGSAGQTEHEGRLLICEARVGER